MSQSYFCIDFAAQSPYIREHRCADAKAVFSEKNFHDGHDPIWCIRTDRTQYIRSFEQRGNLPLSDPLERPT